MGKDCKLHIIAKETQNTCEKVLRLINYYKNVKSMTINFWLFWNWLELHGKEHSQEL